MRRFAPTFALAALVALPAIASANCYSVYNGQNILMYQSTITPIDLSLPLAEATQARFPGAYLVMIPDENRCAEYRTGSTVKPRFDGLGLTSGAAPSDRALQASPLLRNSSSPISSQVGVSGTARPADADAPGLSPRGGVSGNLKR